MRTPLPIIAWCAFHALRVVARIVMFAGLMPQQPANAASIGLLTASVMLSALAIMGLWSMRRWGALLLIGLEVAAVLMTAVSGQMPFGGHAGQAVSVVWIVLLAASVAYYWKQMSWNVFGPSVTAGEGKRYA